MTPTRKPSPTKQKESTQLCRKKSICMLQITGAGKSLSLPSILHHDRVMVAQEPLPAPPRLSEKSLFANTNPALKTFQDQLCKAQGHFSDSLPHPNAMDCLHVHGNIDFNAARNAMSDPHVHGSFGFNMARLPRTTFTFTATSTPTRPGIPSPLDMAPPTMLRSATAVYRDKSLDNRTLGAVVICSRHGRPPFSQRGRPHDLTPKISLPQQRIAVFYHKHLWPTSIFSEGSATRLNA